MVVEVHSGFVHVEVALYTKREVTLWTVENADSVDSLSSILKINHRDAVNFKALVDSDVGTRGVRTSLAGDATEVTHQGRQGIAAPFIRGTFRRTVRIGFVGSTREVFEQEIVEHVWYRNGKRIV
jgi:hypothetical protein